MLPDPRADLTPPHVADAERIRRNLRTGQPAESAARPPAPEEPPKEESQAEEPRHDELSVGHPVAQVAASLSAARATRVVVSNKAIGRFVYMAQQVSINDHSLAFFVPKSDTVWEPPLALQAEVTIAGRTYNAVYAGGFFTFPQLPFVLVSFLIETSDTPT